MKWLPCSAQLETVEISPLQSDLFQTPHFFPTASPLAQKIVYTPNQAGQLLSGQRHCIQKQHNSVSSFPFPTICDFWPNRKRWSAETQKSGQREQWAALGGGVAHSGIKMQEQAQDQAKNSPQAYRTIVERPANFWELGVEHDLPRKGIGPKPWECTKDKARYVPLLQNKCLKFIMKHIKIT